MEENRPESQADQEQNDPNEESPNEIPESPQAGGDGTADAGPSTSRAASTRNVRPPQETTEHPPGPSNAPDRPMRWYEIVDNPNCPLPDPRNYRNEQEYIAAIKKHYNFDIGTPTPPEHLVVVGNPNERESRARGRSDITDEGKALFLEHLHVQFRDMNLDTGRLPPKIGLAACRQAYGRAMLRFERSPTRRSLLEQAYNLEIRSLSAFTYDQILEGFFFDSLETSERILIIFYFCADVIARAVREEAFFKLPDLYNWSVYYIETRLSTWVQSQGGWESFLPPEHSAAHLNIHQYAASLGILCIGLLAMIYFFRRRN